MKTKKRVKVKKYFQGGDFSQAVGGLTTAANSALLQVAAQQDAKKLAANQRREQERNALNTSKKEDTLLLGQQELDGRVGAEYYAEMGGGIRTSASSIKGGKLKPLSSDMEKVEGRTHEEGGVKLGENVEVEDQETIKDGQRVYSDTLKSSNGKTYAANAEKLSREKGKLELDLNKGDAISSNTAKRSIEKIDMKEDALYQEQELSKSTPVQGKFALGGGLNEYAPLLDNVVNSVLTATTPKLRKPVMTRAVNLKTKVNNTPQLAAVNNAVAANTNTILQNSSSSAGVRNAITNTRLKGAQTKAQIRARTENQETNLKNRDVLNKQRVADRNANRSNRFNDQQTARQGVIQSRISANASNLAGDAIDSRNFEEGKRYNNERLAISKTMFNNGITDRTDDAMLEELLKLTGKKN